MIGKGAQHTVLDENDVLSLAAEFIDRHQLAGKKVLAVIPDHTRTAPIGLMFRTLYRLLAREGGKLDFIIALGTHPPMSEEAIDRRLGLDPGTRARDYPLTRVFNHEWNNPDKLFLAGTIPADRVAEISRGMICDPVRVRVNRSILDYDTVLIVGPVFPHEVVGFSGGNKYLFPGIAGQEIIDMFHWLGALITSPVIIGRKMTPVRAVVNEAAALLPVRRLCISLVVAGSDLAGMYCGTPEEAWSAAADLSERMHIKRFGRPFTSVLSCAPAMYDELWVGGKCAYKLEPVVADGGELVIYAPHISELSQTHGRLIAEIGYHVRDYFLAQMARFAKYPGGVLAHSTHVKGLGTYEGGVERPRINVVLATSIPENVCKKINLGWRDPASIRVADWENREDEGVLCVPKAGETLHRLVNDPFHTTNRPS